MNHDVPSCGDRNRAHVALPRFEKRCRVAGISRVAAKSMSDSGRTRTGSSPSSIALARDRTPTARPSPTSRSRVATTGTVLVPGRNELRIFICDEPSPSRSTPITVGAPMAWRSATRRAADSTPNRRREFASPSSPTRSTTEATGAPRMSRTHGPVRAADRASTGDDGPRRHRSRRPHQRFGTRLRHSADHSHAAAGARSEFSARRRQLRSMGKRRKDSMFGLLAVEELLAARYQMALSLGFHIVLVCFGVAFPAMIYVVHRRGLYRGDDGRARCSPSGGRRWPRCCSPSARCRARSSASRWACCGRA